LLRILVVDDSATMRSVLRTELERQAEWIVVGEAGSGRDALKTFRDYRPNVTVMDYSMPGTDGLEAVEAVEAARQLKEQDPNGIILMVTADPTIQLQREARKTGINGFCPKDQVSCLLTAVKVLARGHAYFYYREPAQATP
jgi:DNA-binding NarL/FixJ family response regulator